MTIDYNWCSLKISNDNMYALICLCNNTSEEKSVISEQMILDLLTSHNIVRGVNRIAILSLLDHMEYGQFLCVAQGTPATKGTDGYYEYHKEMQDMKQKPVINADGTADYKNSLSLAIISENELIATYIPPTEGKEGFDIFGNILPALGRGKDCPALRGHGIYSDEDRIHFYARHSGHIVMDGSSVNIEKLYRISGDLDIEVGNVRFDGDVEIGGDVRSGFEIDATGDVFIHGHVGGCVIKSGKNITINKGIQGRGVCRIEAAENIVCKYVESCSLSAGKNIYADSILNASVVAKEQVLVTTKNGNVIGCEVYGMAGVVVKEAGNEIGTPTLLRAGLPRSDYERVGELKKLIYEADQKVEAFNQHLKTLENRDDSTAKDTRMKIMRAKIVLSSAKKEYLEELEPLKERIAVDSKNSFIQITGVVHNDVRINIGMSPYVVYEPIKEITYRVVGGQIVGLSNEEDAALHKDD